MQLLPLFVHYQVWNLRRQCQKFRCWWVQQGVTRVVGKERRERKVQKAPKIKPNVLIWKVREGEFPLVQLDQNSRLPVGAIWPIWRHKIVSSTVYSFPHSLVCLATQKAAAFLSCPQCSFIFLWNMSHYFSPTVFQLSWYTHTHTHRVLFPTLSILLLVPHCLRWKEVLDPRSATKNGECGAG